MTDRLFEGLEVRHVGASGTDERINFGPDSGYERCAPAASTTRRAVASARRVNRQQERLKVLRIHAPPPEERVDIGLDRRLQGGEHLLLLEAPFFGRVSERFRQAGAANGEGKGTTPNHTTGRALSPLPPVPVQLRAGVDRQI